MVGADHKNVLKTYPKSIMEIFSIFLHAVDMPILQNYYAILTLVLITMQNLGSEILTLTFNLWIQDYIKWYMCSH